MIMASYPVYDIVEQRKHVSHVGDGENRVQDFTLLAVLVTLEGGFMR